MEGFDEETRVKTWTGITAVIALLTGCSFPPPEDVPGDLLLLTLTVTGPGAVASADGFIATPTSTSHGYENGAMVTLTASFDVSTTTLAWGGACSGSDPTCVVTMDQVQTVTAAFGLFDRGLTVALAGVGAGKVESTTPGVVIDCGSTCSAPVPDGTVVTLVATPAAGDIFFGWSGGGCSGTGACTTTVTQATLVTATFDNCVRDSRQCTSDRLLVCGADGDFESHLVPNRGLDGEPATVTYDGVSSGSLCPLGCQAASPACVDLPAASVVSDLTDAFANPAFSPAGVDVGQAIVLKSIDTGSFDATTGTTSVTLADDSPYRLPAAVVPLPSGGEILAILVRSLTVPAGTTVAVRGSRSLALVSHFDVVVAGRIDVSGTAGGPGAYTASTCEGAATGASSGGGGRYSSGGAGNTGARGGASTALLELRGGCAGGPIMYAPRGRGGGALQILSRSRVRLTATALIDASGEGGRAACLNVGCFAYGAGGGGAGGYVVFEAPTVSMASGAVVAGRGGNGAAMKYSDVEFAIPDPVMNGASGTTTGSTNASPSTCTGCGVGGVGGTETVSEFAGTAGTGSGTAYAGGGGAVGQCRVVTANGFFSPPVGTMKIRFGTDTI